MPPPYSAQFLKSMERTITLERLTRYLGATGQDVSKALELYEYNVHLSEVLYGLLHGLEVAVRNAQHQVLTVSYGTAAWYDLAPLSPYWHWRDQLNKAKVKPGIGGTPGKVLAELTFGFWIDLIKSANHWTLWVNPHYKTGQGRGLHKAFPNARVARSVIHDRLKAIQLLRNRISHHEPVLTSSNALYNGVPTLITLPQLVECMEWVCFDTAQWMRTQFRYTEAERILKHVAGMKISL